MKHLPAPATWQMKHMLIPATCHSPPPRVTHPRHVAQVNVAYIVAAESFPTLCRNSAIGWGTGCGRIGAMIAPLIMTSVASPLVSQSV